MGSQKIVRMKLLVAFFGAAVPLECLYYDPTKDMEETTCSIDSGYCFFMETNHASVGNLKGYGCDLNGGMKDAYSTINQKQAGIETLSFCEENMCNSNQQNDQHIAALCLSLLLSYSLN